MEHSSALKQGRASGMTFDYGEDSSSVFSEFCETNGVRRGYIGSGRRSR